MLCTTQMLFWRNEKGLWIVEIFFQEFYVNTKFTESLDDSKEQTGVRSDLCISGLETCSVFRNVFRKTLTRERWDGDREGKGAGLGARRPGDKSSCREGAWEGRGRTCRTWDFVCRSVTGTSVTGSGKKCSGHRRLEDGESQGEEVWGRTEQVYNDGVLFAESTTIAPGVSSSVIVALPVPNTHVQLCISHANPSTNRWRKTIP